MASLKELIGMVGRFFLAAVIEGLVEIVLKGDAVNSV